MNDRWLNMTREEKDEFNRLRREKYAQDQEHRKAVNEQNSKWAKANRVSINARLKATNTPKKHRLRNTYGLTLDQYQALLDQRNGICDCCGLPGDLVLDHDHATGKLRGVICPNCNLGIGHFKDSEERLEKAIEYLRRAKCE